MVQHIKYQILISISNSKQDTLNINLRIKRKQLLKMIRAKPKRQA